MKTLNKPVYYCDYCKKHGLSKSSMVRHELICHMNPANDRPCLHCRHLTKKQTTQTSCHYNGAENIGWLNCLYCNKKQIFLHLPKNDIKGNVHELDDYINEKMPLECDDFSTHESIFNETI